MNQEMLLNLIQRSEDEEHDFKEKWYTSHDKIEKIKDIFSFVNTSHHKDCYLVFGVTDERKIVGIENDIHRLNTQQLTNFVINLPIANYTRPILEVETYNIKDHEIDVLIIRDTKDVPVYLSEDKRFSNCKGCICKGQIFTRIFDTNTAIDEIAADSVIECLWKKRFGLDLSDKDQMKIKLKDTDNWEWRYGECVYNRDSDFRIVENQNDSNDTSSLKSYSLNQISKVANVHEFTFLKDKTIVNKLYQVYLDDTKFAVVDPDMGILSDKESYPYNYLVIGSLKYLFLQVVWAQYQKFETEHQRKLFFNAVVLYDDEDQHIKVEEQLKSEMKTVINLIKPKKEWVEDIFDNCNRNYGISNKPAKDNIKLIIKEYLLSVLINGYLKRFKQGNTNVCEYLKCCQQVDLFKLGMIPDGLDDLAT